MFCHIVLIFFIDKMENNLRNLNNAIPFLQSGPKTFAQYCVVFFGTNALSLSFICEFVIGCCKYDCELGF